MQMIGRKNVIWENELGQRVVFDNRILLVEYIDMVGTPGIQTTETPAMTDGQYTINRQLGPKTIPCSFAFKNRGYDDYRQRWLPQVFNPLLKGTLTVLTRTAEYRIECSALNEPVFKRDTSVPYVWRFDVDFAADSSYWTVGEKQRLLVSEIPFSGLSRMLTSQCPFAIAPEIIFPATDNATLFQLYPSGSTSKGFTLSAHPDYPVRVITQSFDVIREDTKDDCSQVIDGTAELDAIRIRYGGNTVMASPDNGILLEYHNLSLGEI